MTSTTENNVSPLRNVLLFLGILGLAFLLYRRFGDTLSLNSIATHDAALRDYQSKSPLTVFGIAFLLYVAVAGLSLPGAVVLTLVYGWYFSFWKGLLLVSFASSAGATIAFLTSRFLLRDAIQRRFADRLTKVNKALASEGPFYLFTLRLIPIIPFFVINLVMGLTHIRTWTFWWVSQIGMLAGTAVYVYAGASVPNLHTLAKSGLSGILSPRLLIAFLLLGIFPMVVKKLLPMPQTAC